MRGPMDLLADSRNLDHPSAEIGITPQILVKSVGNAKRVTTVEARSHLRPRCRLSSEITFTAGSGFLILNLLSLRLD